MGKRITQQARGKGGSVFKVKRKAYKYKIGYPPQKSEGKAKIIKLFNSSAHSAPLIKVKIDKEIFICPAASGIYEGQEIEINGKVNDGNILKLKDIPQGTKIFNIETCPGKGGKILRSSGCSASMVGTDEKGSEILIRRRRLKLNPTCRATIGAAAGEGRLIKPLIKAGKKHHMMLAKGRKWHRTSAIKVNALDHPFGGGRGKRIKSKIAKRNAPPGRKVGHIRPKQTGKRK